MIGVFAYVAFAVAIAVGGNAYHSYRQTLGDPDFTADADRPLYIVTGIFWLPALGVAAICVPFYALCVSLPKAIARRQLRQAADEKMAEKLAQLEASTRRYNVPEGPHR